MWLIKATSSKESRGSSWEVVNLTYRRIQQMAYVCNLKDDEQLRIVERIAHNLQGVELSESVRDVITNALDSKLEDLEDALRQEMNERY